MSEHDVSSQHLVDKGILSDAGTPSFSFIRGNEHSQTSLDWIKGPEVVRKALGEAFGAKNVAFLLGAGCSSMVVDDVELGIPTMAQMAGEFCNACIDDRYDEEFDVPAWLLSRGEVAVLESRGISLTGEYLRNLERLTEVLYSLRFLLQRTNDSGEREEAALIDGVILKLQTFFWSKCTQGRFTEGDDSILRLYDTFYRNLLMRDRSLPRPWIFTTNYDLFNERALDRLGLPYANGFSGVVERRFNPATFRYALAEQIDIASKKLSIVDGYVFLCKLHGSISWTEDDHGLYPIRETWPQTAPSKVMIFPTPAKQNASLGSPYSDLFREFQSRVAREQSVLITIGYAFGDQHLNTIVYQALTIPTFRLIIFADPDSGGDIAKLRALKDPRVWIIGGRGPGDASPAHFFKTVVEQFLPRRPPDRIDDAVRLVLQRMRPDYPGEGEVSSEDR